MGHFGPILCSSDGGWGWGLEATDDDQRPVRWEGGWGWGLEATANDQRPVRWDGGWGLVATADDQRPVQWERVWGWVWGLEATADDQRPVRWGLELEATAEAEVCPVGGGPAVGAGVSEEGR